MICAQQREGSAIKKRRIGKGELKRDKNYNSLNSTTFIHSFIQKSLP
jgi:hypothetical protein